MNISFQYLKSQPNVGELRKVVKEAQSFNSQENSCRATDRKGIASPLANLQHREEDSLDSKSPIKSQLVISGGDKLSARMQSETAQVSSNEGFTPLSTTEEIQTISLSSEAPSEHPLKRTTSDLLSQININNIKNTETSKGDVIRSMGIEVL